MSKNGRILVVEDEIHLAKGLQFNLEREGYIVSLVDNGESAIELLGEQAFDLMILDIMLPEKSGYEVTKQLREHSITTPILMLTAKDELEDKVQGLDLGADDYLTKPFKFEELLARVRALFRRGGMSADSKLSLADLKLDPVTHEVFRNSKKIDLTAKEYALLEYLLRNKGRIATRTTIIEHVWDLHFDSDTNLVDVYIRYLRRKIDDQFEPKLIHTVRGVGYILKVEEGE